MAGLPAVVVEDRKVYPPLFLSAVFMADWGGTDTVSFIFLNGRQETQENYAPDIKQKA